MITIYGCSICARTPTGPYLSSKPNPAARDANQQVTAIPIRKPGEGVLTQVRTI